MFYKQRRARLSNKAWIQLNEFDRFFNLVILVFGLSEHRCELTILKNRIIKLINRSGFNFTFLYLKEVNRLIIRRLCGSEVKSMKILVSLAPDNLPSILPVKFRSLILAGNLLIVRVILTLISIHRVFPTKPKLSRSTITDSFSGITQTLDFNLVRFALRELVNNRSYKLGDLKFIILETASPLAVKSTAASILDIFALIDRPTGLLRVLQLCPNSVKGWLLTLHLMILIVIMLPSYLILKLLRVDLPNGRLSVVYDQAGKARFVAMTNYFYQLVLKRVHDMVFDILKTIPMDGTFDQHKPIKDLIIKGSGTYYCYDLSAATDRLPIKLQVQVLNELIPNLGNIWSSLLDIEWEFKGSYCKYSVGQPMGALSSWAMLALTHHVIVRAAALRRGICNFSDYALLGDDIVIRNDIVASSYLEMMTSLGVSINLNKSVISTDFAEFAKTYKGLNLDFTPLGAGLILQTIRNKSYIGALLANLFLIGHCTTLGSVVQIIQKLPKSERFNSFVGLWCCIGLHGAYFRLKNTDVQHLRGAIAFLFSSIQRESIMGKFSLFNALRQVKREEYHDAIKQFPKDLRSLMNLVHYPRGRKPPLRVFETLFKFMSFAPYLYLFNFLLKYYRLTITYIKFELRDWECSWDEILELTDGDNYNVFSLDWFNKRAIQDVGKRARRIRYWTQFVVKHSELNTFGTLESLVIPESLDHYAKMAQLSKKNSHIYDLVSFVDA